MVFRGVKYHLPSTVPDEKQLDLARVLNENHATRADSLFDATHVITTSEAFEGWQDVGKNTVVVSDLWVGRSIAVNKMQQPGHYSAARSMIFSGVVACSADLHSSDEEVISAGIMGLGGQFRMGLTKDVTHLFAISPNSEKYSTGMSHRDQTSLRVLVPDWFDDSVLLGVRDLSTETYEWPEPEVLTRRPQTPTRLKEKQRSSLSPQKKALYTTASWDPSQPLSKPLLATQDVWGGRRILLSSSLELSGSRRRIVEDGIRKSKGVPVAYSGEGTVEEEVDLLKACDVLVTRHRTGKVFFKAWRAGKTIGTLSWLLNAQVTGVYSSPLDQLLHFPIPPGTVPGFEEQFISVTNYAGEMRDYLKKLITLMGGNFTPNLSTKNTALIAASLSGSKTAKAAEWSIPIVNHTWLEDCFLRWQKLTPATSKYVTYPPGRDFSDLLGERGVGPLIVEIIEEETRKLREEGNADMSDGEEEDREVDNADANYPPHHDSQASADDETEVEGGLLPAMDLDLDPDVDVDMDFGGGDDGANPFDIQDQDEPMLFEEEPEPPRHATPPPKKSPTKAKSQSTPVTPKSATKPQSKRRTRGLSSSEPEIDEEIRKKIIRVPRTPTSPAKSARSKKGKEKEAESRDTASESSADEEPLKLPARRNLVRRVSGPAIRASPRKVPDSTKKTSAGDSDADEVSDAEAQTPVVRRSPRKAPASTRKLPGSTRIVPDSTSKSPAAADSDDQKDEAEDDDVDAPAALRRSPRKVLDSRSGETTIGKLRSLDSDSDDLDDLPVELAPPPRTAKPTAVGRAAKSTEMAATSDPPKKSSTAGKKKEVAPREAAATPTPPSSPLSAPPSRSVKRVPTTPFAVVVPHVQSTSFSASAKKLLPLERKQSIIVVSHHRAAPASASAPPRSRPTAPRASSSGSTAVASSVGPAAPVVENGGRAKRSAATRATKKLHDEIMPDLVNYENERRNRGRKSQSRRVSGPAETDDGDTEQEGPSAKRRKLNGGKGGRTSTSEDEIALEQPAKPKPRKSDVVHRNGKTIKIMTTGLKAEEGTLLSDDIYKTLSKLGAKATTRATECTHLIVPHLVRTENFLCALTSAPFILRREWAVDSAAAEELFPEEDYLLQDDDGERKYNFSLADALSRAKTLKGKLFKDHSFYITKSVKAMNIVKNVVIANGGQAIINWQPSLRTLDTDPNRHVISCAADVALWKQIAITHKVYNYELVLTSALRQEINWEDAAFILEA